MQTPRTSKLLAQNRYNKKSVLYLTTMTEDQYNNFQIDTARAWLEFYWSGVLSIDDLYRTKIFWRWWMCAWNEADDKFILPALYSTHKSKRNTRYRELHQYVFDSNSLHQQFIMADFRHMRGEFENEMRNPTLINQKQ
jgi:hypothetical protein